MDVLIAIRPVLPRRRYKRQKLPSYLLVGGGAGPRDVQTALLWEEAALFPVPIERGTGVDAHAIAAAMLHLVHGHIGA